MRTVLVATVMAMLGGTAVAGSQDRDCATADGSIKMSGHGRISIKYKDDAGKPKVHDVPVALMPDYGSPQTADTLIAIPVGREKRVTRSHQTMHVTHEDGTRCTGRERWDDKSVQRYVVTGRDGANLSFLFGRSTVPGLTDQYYVVADFTCRDHGVTSAGGCRVESDADTFVWK